ncbi:MAG: trypsin-like peptidase domain-containing protein [Planctomycetes bacterium]|nr:trypsin-like peptidase domain-containing protein [Planctomycetota bacterium]
MLIFGFLAARPAAAQEVDGLQAAVAIEKAMTQAIASAERSVVAIARIGPRDQAPAVVQNGPLQFGQINTIKENDPTSPEFVPTEFGTGVVIDEAGLILTCHHVVDPQPTADHYITTVDRRTFVARLLASDAKCDLAILKVEGKPSDYKFSPIKLGDAKTLKKGQIVLALGNPYAIARDGQVSASWGIISNLTRKVVGNNEPSPQQKTLYQFGSLIQTDAKLNLGTSGGPLLNLRGEMIGLTTALAASVGFEQSAGFAIPVDDTFRRLLEPLKQGRSVSYGYLGVQPSNLAYQQRMHGMQGVVVEMVSPHTPAARSDLRRGDLVTAIDGVPVYDADALRLAIAAHGPRAVTSFRVNRDGRQMVIPIRLSKSPNPLPQVVTQQEPLWRGMRVDYPVSIMQLIPLFGEEHDDSGVRVIDVEANSPAAKAGIVRGMLVTRVNDLPVYDPEEFHERVDTMQGAVELTASINTRPQQHIVEQQ